MTPRVLVLFLFSVIAYSQSALGILPNTPPPASPQHTIVVENGDVGALIEAISEANAEEYTDHNVTIEVSGDFFFDNSHSVPPVEATLEIRGPAKFLGAGAENSTTAGDQYGPSQLFHINANAFLKLKYVELTDFSLNHEGEGLIVNDGELVLKNMQISSTYSAGYCAGSKVCTPQMPVISNRENAELSMEQVSIVDSGATNLNHSGVIGILSNSGYAEMSNTQIYIQDRIIGKGFNFLIYNLDTLKVRDSSFYFKKYPTASNPRLLYNATDPGAVAEFSNSIIDGFSNDICVEAVSLGNNLIDADGCLWSSKGDITGERTD